MDAQMNFSDKADFSSASRAVTNRIKLLFERKKKNILSVYFTAGFPKLNDTVPTLKHLQANGVDMLKLECRFLPMADGVVIQNSSHVALKNV
jgi:tryptophan synthase alpha chain